MSGLTNSIGLPINISNPLVTLNGGIGRSVTPTAGSVLFYDSTGIQQNNSNFFWNNSSPGLGIGTNSLDFSGVNLQITSSGACAVIRNPVSGSLNQSSLYICRGDQPNGTAVIIFNTGMAASGTVDWQVGTFNSTFGTPTSLLFNSSSGSSLTKMILSTGGNLNLPVSGASVTASLFIGTPVNDPYFYNTCGGL